jgi:hypothetical protein
MSLLQVCERLEATRWSTALRESTYVYAAVESVHVLTLALFLGLVIVTDLRLTGLGFRGLPAGEMVARLRPWIRAGFVVMATSGILLFIAQPAATFTHPAFRAKLALLSLAGANAAIFHAGIYRSAPAWDPAAAPPPAARIAGVVSLIVWAGVVAAGRLIAYDFLR